MKNKIELYLMSLGLLFVLFIIKVIDIPITFGDGAAFIGWRQLLQQNVFTVILLFLVLVSTWCLHRFMNAFKNGSKDIPSRIVKIKSVNYEYVTFLMTYIIPLICFDLANWRDLVLLIVLLVLLGFLFIKTNLYYLNPTLALFGVNVYIADISYKQTEQKDVILLSRVALDVDDSIFKYDLERGEVAYCSKSINQ